MSALDRFRLDGRTALVTGASGGIGAALAEGLAQAGATVVLAARRTDRLDAQVSRLRAAGAQAHAVAMDVTDAASVAAAFDAAEERAGVAQVIVNNAGIADARRFVNTTDESLNRVLATNFHGVWNVCQQAAKRLLAAGLPGSIVNIASILGIGAGSVYASYAASKAAVIQLTRSLALELARQNVRVNAIAPGWFVTDINAGYFASDAGREHVTRMPAGRTGELAELVGPVLLLASDAGSYVNGVVLPVDAAHSIALV